MSTPLVEGEPVLILWVLTRTTEVFGGAAQRTRYVGHRMQRAVVSSSVIDGAVQAREQRWGRNLRPLNPDGEGISWCRGWEPEARDALLASFKLYRSAMT